MAKTPRTRILTRGEISPLLDPKDYIEGVEYAFRRHGEGRSFGMAMIHADTPGDVEFHIKAGGLQWKEKSYFALKANGSSFRNGELRGLPNILGAILLFDAESGYPLAIMDSSELTRQRTAAGTAVALKYLAPAGAHTLLLCGCGVQGRIHLKYLNEVLRLERVLAYDVRPETARAFARDMEKEVGLPVEAVTGLSEAAARSRLIVTCTPSRAPFLRAADVRPGTTVAAVGADSPSKQEIEAGLLRDRKVVVDVLRQCAVAGELHHALEEGLITEADVHAEIGEIVAGRKTGRESAEETIIYDATGTAIQDTAAAILVCEKAEALDIGLMIDLFA
ncbi:MAG: ornithine cyclodeaminase family protein [Candidatus Aminicenantales bacterium]|jgi:ornithine cyclodeaminase/alanine dehydrogenase-like protein (mu-crystallin family)